MRLRFEGDVTQSNELHLVPRELRSTICANCGYALEGLGGESTEGARQTSLVGDDARGQFQTSPSNMHESDSRFRQIPMIKRARKPSTHRQSRVLPGDATMDATLNGAGIDRARALVAAAGSDADNVLVTMTARPPSTRAMLVCGGEPSRTCATSRM